MWANLKYFTLAILVFSLIFIGVLVIVHHVHPHSQFTHNKRTLVAAGCMLCYHLVSAIGLYLLFRQVNNYSLVDDSILWFFVLITCSTSGVLYLYLLFVGVLVPARFNYQPSVVFVFLLYPLCPLVVYLFFHYLKK